MYVSVKMWSREKRFLKFKNDLQKKYINKYGLCNIYVLKFNYLVVLSYILCLFTLKLTMTFKKVI